MSSNSHTDEKIDRETVTIKVGNYGQLTKCNCRYNRWRCHFGHVRNLTPNHAITSL